MKVQKARRLNLTDYPDAPEWAHELYQVLNIQFERWVTLFQNNITFGDNTRSEVVTLDMEHDVTLPIRLEVLQRNPIGVLFLGSNYFEYPRLTWEPAEDAGIINVKVKWDVEPDDVVRSTLLFIGE